MGDYLLVWYNVWFTAPIAFVFLFAIFQLVMGGLDFGGEADMEVDADVDVDVDVDVDAEMDVDADHGAHGSSFVASVLGILNVGKVPFTIILMSLFAAWGMSGLIVNELLNIGTDTGITRLGLPPQSTLWISLAAAFLCSIFGTRYLALGLSKLFPESERAVTDYQLLGLRARVISGRVTTTFGAARVQVRDGPELTVSCRTREGEDDPLKGDTVILINYDSKTRIFDVKKMDNLLSQ